VADEINNTVSTFTPDGRVILLSGGLSHPLAIASDAAGNIYVANQGNNTVSMISTSGGVSTFASGFYQPDALAFDGSGNLYVANALTDPSTISKVTPAGVVSTFASGFAYPSALAFDGTKNLYVANPGNNTVSKVTPAGVVSTFASGFGYPTGLAFDGGGNLYVANWTSNTVSKVTPAGVVSTFASGFNGPMGLAFDGSGNLYVANYANSTVNGTISKVTPAGVVTTFFGNLSDLVAISAVTAPAPPTITLQPQSVTLPAGENAAFSIDVSGAPGSNMFQWQVSADGGTTWTPLSNNAPYSGVTSATLTVNGAISGYEYECVVTNTYGSATSNPAMLTHQPFLMYVANASSSTVSAITPAGAASTFASSMSGALAVDKNGNLYVANEGNGTVSKVTPAGLVSTFASGFNEPTALACDISGNLYVANEGNGTISKVTSAGVTNTFASGFGDPTALACDANGNLYVADYDYSTVSKITQTGAVSLYASEVFNPEGLAFDASGNLYEANVAGLIEKITPAGVMTTFASGLYDPDGLAFDGSGNLYVINGNGPISMITSGGGSTFVSGLGDLTSIAIVTAPVPLTTSNYTVAVSALPSAGGTVSGGGAFPSGSPSLQTVTATANSGYAFVNWTENGNVVSSSPVYSFTLGGNVSLVATFYNISYQTLDDPLAATSSGGGTYAAGISGGDIVGHYTDINGHTGGFVNISNVFIPLQDPNANGFTAASGVSGGNIVGSFGNGSWHGFLYSDGIYTTYSYFDGLYGNANANGINGTNVVGSFPDDNGTHGWLYNGITYTTLDDPNSIPVYNGGYLQTGCYTVANGVSGNTIVGSYAVASFVGLGVSQGFVYSNGTYTTLDVPNATGGTSANGIDGNNIVGYYTDSSGKTHGFLYNGANFATLDDPNGVGSTYAMGISGNIIVGYYIATNNVAHGFTATLTIGFNANPTNGTVPLAVQFTSPRVDGDRNPIAFWNWNFGDGSTSTNENPSHVYTNPGTFLLSLVVTNSLGFAVPVYGPTSITASLPTIQYAVNQTNGPAPLTAQFTSSGVDIANNTITHWNWNFGDGSTSTNQNPTHVYTNAGTYLPSLVATNNLGVTVIGVGPSLIVANPVEYFGLVLNGGFESGDFTGWSESGNFDYCSIANNSTCVHSGNYGAELGPAGSLGYISQTLSTSPGKSYLLSLWLDSPDGQYPNECVVSWNGNILFDETNLPATGWTNLQFLVSATETNTVLELGFRDDPSYLGLDDISVVAEQPSIAGITLFGANLTINGSTGQSGQTYVTLMSTNLALPFNQWTPVATNLLNVSGNFTITVTNTVNRNIRQRYYILQQQ
jgi:DNA-binding beta-propeller fold protein YncE/PKD repeat protein